MPDRYDVFLSHSTSSSDVSTDIARELRSQGYSVFYDRDSVDSGVSFEDNIRHGLQASGSVIVVLDSSSGSSPWVSFEAGAAISLGKPILPVLSTDIPSASVPEPFRSLQSVRYESTEQAVTHIKTFLDRVSGTDQKPSS